MFTVKPSLAGKLAARFVRSPVSTVTTVIYHRYQLFAVPFATHPSIVRPIHDFLLVPQFYINLVFTPTPPLHCVVNATM